MSVANYFGHTYLVWPLRVAKTAHAKTAQQGKVHRWDYSVASFFHVMKNIHNDNRTNLMNS